MNQHSPEYKQAFARYLRKGTAPEITMKAGDISSYAAFREAFVREVEAEARDILLYVPRWGSEHMALYFFLAEVCQ